MSYDDGDGKWVRSLKCCACGKLIELDYPILVSKYSINNFYCFSVECHKIMQERRKDLEKFWREERKHLRKYVNEEEYQEAMEKNKYCDGDHCEI